MCNKVTLTGVPASDESEHQSYNNYHIGKKCLALPSCQKQRSRTDLVSLFFYVYLQF